MVTIPDAVVAFLRGRRFAVAGVSRQPGQAANAAFRKLIGAGYEVFPINPKASEVEGVKCYSGVGSVPGRGRGMRSEAVIRGSGPLGSTGLLPAHRG